MKPYGPWIATILVLPVVCALGCVWGTGQDETDNRAETECLIAVEAFTLHSQVLGEDRTIRVRLPDDYADSTDPYPVLYLAGHRGQYLQYASGTIRILSQMDVIPEMIVVRFDAVDGRRDFTPTQTANYGPNSGGADEFIRHVRDEVIPAIEDRYRTKPTRVFWGHSITAAWALHAFLTQPSLFEGAILSSPWLIYDHPDSFLLDSVEPALSQRTNERSFLYITIGDEPRLKPAVDAFISRMVRASPRGVRWRYETLAEETHRSIMPATLIPGLRAFFTGGS